MGKNLLTFLLMCTFSLGTFAQNITVNGTVKDAKNEPLVGVTIRVVGSTVGTITDYDGNYTLPDVPADATLEFSYVGMQTETIALGGRKSLDVVLSEDVSLLSEVVVVGYGTQSKRRVTTAVSSIDAEDIRRSSSTTTAGALSGKMAGVSTRALDSRPGRGINIEIRNMGKPLYVIDGIPYGGEASRNWLGKSNVSGEDAFNALSLEDIESISILKDASASIYGLRASSGVVLVTTKKGRKDDRATVNVNAYYGWQNLTRFPKMASAPQYVRGLLEAEQNSGKDPSALYTPEEFAKWQAGTEPGYKSYDYYDITHVSHFPQTIDKEIEGKCINLYISVF
jgi:TonB-dependent SusC/RagA subfamily outer membrane receptor